VKRSEKEDIKPVALDISGRTYFSKETGLI
jgi:hypothetical protein